MTNIERKERFMIVEEKCELYESMYEQGTLLPADVKRYLDTLKELDRLKEINLCEMDILRFAKRYFNNGRLLKPETPSPEFHRDLAEEILSAIQDKTRSSYLAFVAPRSHAKTVFAIVIVALYCVCYDIHKYWIIISNRQDGAKQILAMIKYELANNEELCRDFGELFNKDHWSMMEIVALNGVKVQAAGSGDAIRGSNHLGERPWVLMDDIEKDPDVMSADYRDKMHDWFNQTVIPIGSPSPGGTKIIWVGTILHVDSVLNRIMKEDTRFKTRRYSAIKQWPVNMGIWEQWKEVLISRDYEAVENPDDAATKAGEIARQFYYDHKEQMDEGAEVLWPQRMSLYDLMVIWAENRKAFLTEYAGDPRDESTVLFNKITYYDSSEIGAGYLDELDIYGAVDPSLAKNKDGDPSAIVTVGRHKKTGIIYILDVDGRLRQPEKIISDVIMKARLYKYRKFGVETVHFQHLFKSQLAQRSAAEGVYLPIIELKPHSDKWLRISTMEPYISNGFVRFHKSHRPLVEQLEAIGTDGNLPKHDDLADCLEMAVSLIISVKRTVSFGTLN